MQGALVAACPDGDDRGTLVFLLLLLPMKFSSGFLALPFCALVLGFLLPVSITPGISASTLITQSIPLKKGWNAVYLEVEPEDTSVETVFSGLDVEIVASYFPPAAPTQFVSNPDEAFFQQTGWGVWYSPERSDSFLSTLFAVYGQRAYLIYAGSNFTLEIEGQAMVQDHQWQPNSYNFVGFSVDDTAPPTYSQFFEQSEAHQDLRIYRLVNGQWVRLNNPSTTAMKSGEAFWIYCDGSSEWDGPLDIEAPSQQGMVLFGEALEVTLHNRVDYPVATEVEIEAGDLALAIVVTVLDQGSSQILSVPAPLPSFQALGSLDGGTSLALPFAPRLEALTAYRTLGVLKFTTDIGTVFRIPVALVREDLDP